MAVRLPSGDNDAVFFGEFTLGAKSTFVFKIEQQLGPPIKKEQSIYGQATARSSVGRVEQDGEPVLRAAGATGQ